MSERDDNQRDDSQRPDDGHNVDRNDGQCSVNTSPLVTPVVRPDGSTYLAPKWVWSAEKEQAACDLAEGLRIGKIVERLEVAGIGYEALLAWRRHPEFQKRVEEYREIFRQRVMEYGIARREVRIQKLQDDFDATEVIIEERSEAEQRAAQQPEAATVPGGKSGRVGRKQTQHGTEYRFDRALVAERRELLKQAAIEMGEWQESPGDKNEDALLQELAAAIRNSPAGDVGPTTEAADA